MDFEFTIDCPLDGPVTVSMSHLMFIAAHGDSQARLSFKCPKCGRRLNTIEDIPREVFTMLSSLTNGDFSGIKDLFDQSLEKLKDTDGLDDEAPNIRKIFLTPDDLKRDDVRNFLNGFSENPSDMDGGMPLFPGMQRKRGRDFDLSEHVRKLDKQDFAQIDYYKHQLEGITTVDELLDELV